MLPFETEVKREVHTLNKLIKAIRLLLRIFLVIVLCQEVILLLLRYMDLELYFQVLTSWLMQINTYLPKHTRAHTHTGPVECHL